MVSELDRWGKWEGRGWDAFEEGVPRSEGKKIEDLEDQAAWLSGWDAAKAIIQDGKDPDDFV